jgi:hypothetical protein
MAGSQAGLPQQVPSIVDSLKYCLPACLHASHDWARLR